MVQIMALRQDIIIHKFSNNVQIIFDLCKAFPVYREERKNMKKRNSMREFKISLRAFSAILSVIFDLKTLVGAASYEFVNRFTDFKYCASADASTRSMIFAYGVSGYYVVDTIISVFSDDPSLRAAFRRYSLK